MKRRNAVFLFTTLTVMSVGYVAWCGRCFYIKPGLEFHPNIPQEMRVHVQHWHESQKVTTAREFEVGVFAEMFMNPFGSHPRPMHVDTCGLGDATVYAVDHGGYLIGFQKAPNGEIEGPEVLPFDY